MGNLVHPLLGNTPKVDCRNKLKKPGKLFERDLPILVFVHFLQKCMDLRFTELVVEKFECNAELTAIDTPVLVFVELIESALIRKGE